MAVDTVQMPRANPRLPGAEDAVARRVAYERERRGWSTAELARRMTAVGVPVNQSAIYKIEKGSPRRTISLDEALALAEVFGIEMADLMRPAGEITSEEVADLLERKSDWHDETVEFLRVMSRTLEAWQQRGSGDPDAMRSMVAEIRKGFADISDSFASLRAWVDSFDVETKA